MQKAEAGAGGVVGHEDDRDGRAIPDDPCGARNQEAAQEQDVAGPAGAPEDEGLPAPVRVPVMLVPYGPWPGWQAELVISRPSMGLHELYPSGRDVAPWPGGSGGAGRHRERAGLGEGRGKGQRAGEGRLGPGPGQSPSQSPSRAGAQGGLRGTGPGLGSRGKGAKEGSQVG